jgi:hypothetical protein
MSPFWLRLTMPIWLPLLAVYLAVRLGYDIGREVWTERGDL